MIQIYVLDKHGFIEGADFCESVPPGEETTIISFIADGRRQIKKIEGRLEDGI